MVLQFSEECFHFEYVKESDRYCQKSLDDLITDLSNQTAADIELAKAALHEANVKVVSSKEGSLPTTRKNSKKSSSSNRRTLMLTEGLDTLKHDTEQAEFESAAVTLATENLRQARQTIERHLTCFPKIRTQLSMIFAKERGRVYVEE